MSIQLISSKRGAPELDELLDASEVVADDAMLDLEGTTVDSEFRSSRSDQSNSFVVGGTTWGTWKIWSICPAGLYVNSFAMQIEEYIHGGDTGPNVITTYFPYNTTHESGLNVEGSAGTCNVNTTVCGVRMRFEDHETGNFDDTAMNQLEFACCCEPGTSRNPSDSTCVPNSRPMPNAWHCIPGIAVPVRMANDDGPFQRNPECFSVDGVNCAWDWGLCNGKSGAVNLDLSVHEAKPLACGAESQASWGITGYGRPDHWCVQSRNYFGVSNAGALGEACDESESHCHSSLTCLNGTCGLVLP